MLFWDVLLVCHSAFVTCGTPSRSALNSSGVGRHDGVQFDERGPGFRVVPEPALVLATAVLTLAARGWPAGDGRGSLRSLLDGAGARNHGDPARDGAGGMGVAERVWLQSKRPL